MEKRPLRKLRGQAERPRLRFDLGVDPYRSTLTTAAEQLERARVSLEQLFETEDNVGYARAVLRRIAFIEACLKRALQAKTSEDRFRSLDFCLKNIEESRELLFVASSRRPRLERTTKLLRTVMNTTRAVLTAALRLRQHADRPRHVTPALRGTNGGLGQLNASGRERTSRRPSIQP